MSFQILQTLLDYHYWARDRILEAAYADSMVLVEDGQIVEGSVVKVDREKGYGALRALDLLSSNRSVNQFDIYVGTSAGSFVAGFLMSDTSGDQPLVGYENAGLASVIVGVVVVALVVPISFYLPPEAGLAVILGVSFISFVLMVSCLTPSIQGKGLTGRPDIFLKTIWKSRDDIRG